MLEVAWEAFEDAGYRPGQETGPVSVMVGTGGNVTNYLANVLNNHPDARGPTASLLHIGNDKDFASTRVSYKLDLTGPSLNIQTACSTSLIAVHLACQSILNGECKMALAGGANIRVPEKAGYPVVKGGLYSPDGHIRTFDADARGTVFGSGVGAVLLKDLQSALDDGDHIYAVIKGSAINNDGGVKASFSGSSANGQAGAMIAAMTAAGVEPDTIGYVECHGTGTAVGDPLEIDALTRAFRTRTDRRNFCAAGSVKPNIGHPEQAAGVAAMIKAVLAIQSGQIPPTINIRTVNPKIDFESSPFFINTEMLNWPITDGPRRALCNSLGIGGTNGVVILEQAPSRIRPVTESERPVHAFTLSAKSKPALDALIARYRDWLDDAPDVPLSDICYTLAVGRTPFAFRFAAGVASLDEVRRKLAAPHTAARPDPNRRIGFLFSGQGAQFPRMARDLYQTQPVFRAALDRCAEAMRPHLNPPLLDILFADDERALRINRTGYTQPALFAVQVALTELLATWGIRPDAVVGHSVGEFAAAYLIGVYTLDDAARLVCTRGRLMESLPEGGAMAAILADEAT
ncbi:MAG: type I polyketide synthase, partial [Rhodospirillaceae bacterium]